MRVLFIVSVITLAGISASGSTPELEPQSPTQGSSRQTVSKAEYERWKAELSNWGRWGKEDQLGALNLVTPAKRRQAAALVKEGFNVSLSLDGSLEKGPNPNSTAPYERVMTQVGRTGAGDRLNISYHGFLATHVDAFGHRFFDGKMYNGFSYEEVTKDEGAKKGSIYNLRSGIVTRGVLVDIPRLRGVEYLQPGARIYPEDLDAWEKKTGTKVLPGDALLIRTGRWTWMRTVKPSPVPGEVAGLDASVIPWLKKRDIAVLASEHAQDAMPYQPDFGEGPILPVHDFALVMLGIHLFDNTNLDELAEAAAARKRWEFMLVAAPLRVPGGTGSPLNPIAIF